MSVEYRKTIGGGALVLLGRFWLPFSFLIIPERRHLKLTTYRIFFKKSSDMNMVRCLLSDIKLIVRVLQAHRAKLYLFPTL